LDFNFSDDDTFSNGDAFSAVAPDVGCSMAIRGGPRCRAVPWMGRQLGNPGYGVNSRSQSLGCFEIAHRNQHPSNHTRAVNAFKISWLAVGFRTENCLQMGGKIEVKRHPNIGDEPLGLWRLANANSASD
jgi:hypothetical protein